MRYKSIPPHTTMDETLHCVVLALNKMMKVEDPLRLPEKVEANKTNKRKNEDNMFSLAVEPDISLLHYIKRIESQTKYEANVFVNAVLYMAQISSPSCVHCIPLTPLTVHVLLATSVSVSAKVLHDRPIGDGRFANRRCSGLQSELYEFESELLRCLDYKLIVQLAEHNKWHDYIMGLN